MKKTSTDSRITRRHFLAATGAALAFPTFIPAKALGRGGHVAPSEKVVMGVTGWGMQGPGNTQHFLGIKECQVVAACDLDEGRLFKHDNSAVKTINRHYGNQDCKRYHDYREMLARADIDAVMLAVPDHWHALVAVEAANRKKDIYGEKPLARTVAEQQAIVHAVEKNDRIWQTGSWQRSEANFHKAAEIVRNGYIGRVTHCEVGLPAGHTDFPHTVPDLLKKLPSKPTDNDVLTKIVPGTPDWDAAISEPPEGFDYETWIGPSRMEPYISVRVYQNWRWNYNTGGGQLLDWIGHHCDIAHWGLGFDRSGPSEIEGHGEFPPANAIWNTTGKYRIELKYPHDITMTIAGGYKDIRDGTKWIGTDGFVWVNRGNAFESSNDKWSEMRSLPEKMRKVKLYRSTDHWKNFIDCVKSRQPTIAPVQTAHHSAIPGHLGLISMLVGRKVRWDVASERILHDEEASNLLTRPYREPWMMPSSHVPASHEILRSPKAVADS